MSYSEKPYLKYWGKADSNTPQGPPFHLLPWHCLDVAAVAWHLFNPSRPLIHDLSQILRIPVEPLRKLLCALVAMHDLGKFAAAFQNLFDIEMRPKPCHLISHTSHAAYDGKKHRHDMLGWCFFYAAQEKGLLHTTNNQQSVRITTSTLARWFDVVFGHHGQPTQHDRSATRRFCHPNDIQAALEWIHDIWSFFEAQWPYEAMAEDDWPYRFAQVSWLIAGTVILADWLGSDKQYFPYQSDPCNGDLASYWQQTLMRAEQAMKAHGLRHQNHIAPFKSIRTHFGFEHPTPLQQWAASVPIDDSPQLFILEDITGSGKTEAALTLTHRLMACGAADGLYFGLPTMATSNAMFTRASHHSGQMFSDLKNTSILLAHSANRMNDDFQAILKGSHRDGYSYAEQDRDIRAQCNQWFADSRKKALLANVGVGTIDQALMAALPVKHQPLRVYGLYRKVLIYDELHSADEYMLTLLARLLEIHRAQGGSVILLTATLSMELRQKLLRAWLGRDLPIHDTHDAFPLASKAVADGQLTQTPVQSRPEVSRFVAVDFVHDDIAVLEEIHRAMQQNKCVVWVRNTVHDALQAYQQICASDIGEPILFHSRFTLKDRQTKEQIVLHAFGKDSTHDDRRGKVLIATQVFQESLDADADLLISDLCPIDYLIQRAGRLCRHKRDVMGNRIHDKSIDDERGTPRLVVLAPLWSNHPSDRWYAETFPKAQHVYPATHLLWLTQKTLQALKTDKGGYALPQDARHMIESVYASTAHSADALPESMHITTQASGQKGREKQHIANNLSVDWQQGYTKSSVQRHWHEDHDGDSAQASTRFVEMETADVMLVKRYGAQWKPWVDDARFAVELSTLRLPAYLLKPHSASARLSLLDEQQTTALCQTHPHAKYHRIWCPEEDVNYGYDPMEGFHEKSPP